VFARLALLFVVIPIVELVILIQLGGVLGLWPTLGLVVATGFAGAFLARLEGYRTFLAFQRELAKGSLPSRSLMDGLSVLIGGALLLTPGLLTDVVGFSLLVPMTRRVIQRRVRSWIQRRITDGTIEARIVNIGPYPTDRGPEGP
jgi:UPF0716 protein FxsA